MQWDLNNYNVWFYTVFYTIDYVDILFIWLNRTFISRPIIFQQVGSTEASVQEAAQLINPMKTIIQVRTAKIHITTRMTLIELCFFIINLPY